MKQLPFGVHLAFPDRLRCGCYRHCDPIPDSADGSLHLLAKKDEKRADTANGYADPSSIVETFRIDSDAGVW